jgi:hypothetical protein
LQASPAGQIALVDPTGIAYAEADAETRVSQQGSVDLSPEPGGAAEHVSLWQNNLVAIMATIRITWRVIRPGSVAIITGAAYGGGET